MAKDWKTEPRIWDAIYKNLKNGWCQGHMYHDENGNETTFPNKAKECCLWGAVVKATDTNELENPYHEYIRRVLPKEFHRSIVVFNDNFNTTQEQVMDVVLKAKGLAAKGIAA